MRSQIPMLCKPRGRTCARRSDWPEPRVDAPHLPSKRRHASLLIHPPPGVMLAILILLLVALSGVVAATPSLSLSISVPQSAGVDELSVVATITNTGKYPLKLLNHPQTILSHFPTRIFDIRRGNDTPEFIGAIVHYSPEYVISRNNSVDFTFLSPGDTSERAHTLAGVYNFTGIGPGEFQIVVHNRFYHVDASANIIPFDAETQPITFNLTSSLSRKKTIPFTRLGLSNRCTPEQQTTLTAAITSATNLISSALTYLSTLTTDSPRYTTWFGLYDPARIQTVKSNYANSLSAIQSTYDCAPDACQDGSVAYVWRQQPGVVHLCGWFWLRPGYGSDSQAGTIIHELSHFAGTEDYVYGQLGARDLAVSSPGVAVVNADNYMYFAENYPALS